EGREAALMADLREGIGLVHELRELATAEKFLHSGNDRTNIDQCVRCCLARLLDTHALLYDTLHTQEADTELRLDQFSNAAHAAVAKVIDVVFAAVSVVQRYRRRMILTRSSWVRMRSLCGVERSSFRL